MSTARSTEPAAKSPRETRVEMAQLVLPNDANTLGNVLGGRVMHWIDLAAAIVAHRHCRTEAVTASMDEVSFLAPIRVGQLAILDARMTYAARTSMEIRVDVDCEDLLTGARRRTSSAYLTFVSIDKRGRPISVPPLRYETDEERSEATGAEERRARRLASRAAQMPTGETRPG